MSKRHVAAAVLAILCTTSVFAAPNDDTPRSSPFDRALQRVIRVIRHIVQPLDMDGISPPHP